MVDSSQLLVIESGLRHFNLVKSEAAAEGLVDILATLWSDTHPLVSYLLSLMYHNARERHARVEWAAEYEILPMHFLRRLILNLNTWYISVEEEAGEIYPPSMYELCFEIDRHMIERPHMPSPEALHPGMPASRPDTNQAPSAVTEKQTTKPRALRGGRSRWTPPT